MNKLIGLVCLAILGFQAQGATEVGESVSNLCWQGANASTQCLDDHAGKVRVLLFNAGWCGPCNSHMTDLGTRVQQYNGKPVVFLSLSVSGWQWGTPADESFLQQWKDKHSIPFAALAAGNSDMDQLFSPPHYIPSDAIVDPEGRLAFRAVGPSIEQLFGEIDKVLPAENPIQPLPHPEG